jgi:hypothetical protein
LKSALFPTLGLPTSNAFIGSTLLFARRLDLDALGDAAAQAMSVCPTRMITGPRRG